LTTGPLGGGVAAASPASHLAWSFPFCGPALLIGERAQKGRCEYSSCTVWPSNHASVKPMSMQPGPPSLHGRDPVPVEGGAADTTPGLRAKIDAIATKDKKPTLTGPA